LSVTRNPVPRLLGAMLVLALVAGAILFFLRRGDELQKPVVLPKVSQPVQTTDPKVVPSPIKGQTVNLLGKVTLVQPESWTHREEDGVVDFTDHSACRDAEADCPHVLMIDAGAKPAEYPSGDAAKMYLAIVCSSNIDEIEKTGAMPLGTPRQVGDSVSAGTSYRFTVCPGGRTSTELPLRVIYMRQQEILIVINKGVSRPYLEGVLKTSTW